MSATWQMLPEELVTKIGDFSDFGTKISLRSCSHAEKFALEKSKITISLLKINLEGSKMELEFEEGNGQKWRIEPIWKRTRHPYEDAYFLLLDHLNFALSHTKNPVEKFLFIGEPYDYPEIFKIPKLIKTSNVHLLCSDPSPITEKWLPKFENLVDFHYGITESGEREHHSLTHFPIDLLRNVKNLSIGGFAEVDFSKFLSCSNLENLTVSALYTKSVVVFLKSWSDPQNNLNFPKFPVNFRTLYLNFPYPDSHTSSFVKFQLRDQIRKIRDSESSNPLIDHFLMRRKTDGACAKLEFHQNFIKFSYFPGKKYETLREWEQRRLDVDEEDAERVFGNIYREVAPNVRNASSSATGAGFWH